VRVPLTESLYKRFENIVVVTVQRVFDWIDWSPLGLVFDWILVILFHLLNATTIREERQTVRRWCVCVVWESKQNKTSKKKESDR